MREGKIPKVFHRFSSKTFLLKSGGNKTLIAFCFLASCMLLPCLVPPHSLFIFVDATLLLPLLANAALLLPSLSFHRRVHVPPITSSASASPELCLAQSSISSSPRTRPDEELFAVSSTSPQARLKLYLAQISSKAPPRMSSYQAPPHPELVSSSTSNELCLAPSSSRALPCRDEELLTP